MYTFGEGFHLLLLDCQIWIWIMIPRPPLSFLYHLICDFSYGNWEYCTNAWRGKTRAFWVKSSVAAVAKFRMLPRTLLIDKAFCPDMRRPSVAVLSQFRQ